MEEGVTLYWSHISVIAQAVHSFLFFPQCSSLIPGLYPWGSSLFPSLLVLAYAVNLFLFFPPGSSLIPVRACSCPRRTHSCSCSGSSRIPVLAEAVQSFLFMPRQGNSLIPVLAQAVHSPWFCQAVHSFLFMPRQFTYPRLA